VLLVHLLDTSGLRWGGGGGEEGRCDLIEDGGHLDAILDFTKNEKSSINNGEN